MVRIVQKRSLEVFGRLLGIGLLPVLGAVAAVSASSAERPSGLPPASVELGEDYRSMAYTKNFAERFGLDPARSFNLAPGLLAMEFRITRPRDPVQARDCQVNLFVESALDVWYPEDSSDGSFADLLAAEDNALSGLRLSDKDAAALVRREAAYVMRAFFVDDDQDRVGRVSQVSGLSYLGFHRDLFNGISYISLRAVACGTLPPPGKGAVLWLQKPGGHDYSRPENTVLTAEEFHRFRFPDAFDRALCPYVQEVEVRTQDLMFTEFPEVKADLVSAGNFPYHPYPGC